MIAERIVQLGGIAEGTARVAAAHSQLEEYPLTIADGHDHVEAVARALSAFGHVVRGTINEADELDDAGTADLFTEISAELTSGFGSWKRIPKQPNKRREPLAISGGYPQLERGLRGPNLNLDTRAQREWMEFSGAL